MTRKEILEEAARITSGQRNTDYGPPEDSFARIADYWTTYLRHRGLLAPDKVIAPLDTGMMMILMKVARGESGPGKADGWIDLAGYSACTGELATKDTQMELPIQEPNRRYVEPGETIPKDAEVGGGQGIFLPANPVVIGDMCGVSAVYWTRQPKK